MYKKAMDLLNKKPPLETIPEFTAKPKVVPASFGQTSSNEGSMHGRKNATTRALSGSSKNVHMLSLNGGSAHNKRRLP